MIWLNYKGWSSYKFSTRFGYSWTWKRLYGRRYGRHYKWTPFIYLEIKKIKK